MTKVNIIAKDMGVDHLPDVLFSIVDRKATLEEFLTDFGHFRVDHFVLLIFTLAIADIPDKHGKPANRIFRDITHS
jgi:hypothetical protein